MFQRRGRGTTLIELMVAVGFMGICAVALLDCVNMAQTREGYAKRRAIILAAAQDYVDAVRATATGGTIPVGANIYHLTVSGLEQRVTLTQTVALVGGYADLYSVDVRATWTENGKAGVSRADSLDLTTYIRANDT